MEGFGYVSFNTLPARSQQPMVCAMQEHLSSHLLLVPVEHDWHHDIRMLPVGCKLLIQGELAHCVPPPHTTSAAGQDGLETSESGVCILLQPQAAWCAPPVCVPAAAISEKCHDACAHGHELAAFSRMP